jgi:spore coat protein U-like protein
VAVWAASTYDFQLFAKVVRNVTPEAKKLDRLRPLFKLRVGAARARHLERRLGVALRVPFFNPHVHTGNAAMPLGKFVRNTLFCFTLSALVATLAHAATTTTTFGVSTTISGVCVVSTASAGLSFGTYDPTSGSDTLGTTTFKVECSSGLSYTVGLSAGGSGSDTARTMSSGANRLNYSLYADSGRSTNWGASTGALAGTGAGLATENTITVYGKIPKNQYGPGIGAYSDSITATITY